MACSVVRPVERQSVDEGHADAVSQDGPHAGHRLATRPQRELLGRQHEDGQGLAGHRLRQRQELGDGGIGERHRPFRRGHGVARPRPAIGDLVIEHGHRRGAVEVEIRSRSCSSRHLLSDSRAGAAAAVRRGSSSPVAALGRHHRTRSCARRPRPVKARHRHPRRSRPGDVPIPARARAHARIASCHRTARRRLASLALTLGIALVAPLRGGAGAPASCVLPRRRAPAVRHARPSTEPHRRHEPGVLIRLFQSTDCWYAAAAWSSMSSRKWGATSMRPTGIPSSLAHGTLMAGCPV